MTTQSIEDDWELLREYAERGSEEAFARVVAAHVDMVYSAALRQVRRRDLAEEVTQVVFVILARKAATLDRGVPMGAWLHKTARYTAANVLRVEARRRAHERKAGEMSINYARVDSSWERLAPVLDEGIARLGDRDRAAIVLRFFERKSLAETGRALGVSEEAAGMRVSRALAKLREFFARRGVALPAAALGGVMAANSVQAAPAGLGAAVSGKAVAAAHGAVAAAAYATMADAVCRSVLVAKAKAVAVVVAVVLGVGAGGVMATQYLVIPLWQRAAAAAAAPSPAPRSEHTDAAGVRVSPPAAVAVAGGRGSAGGLVGV